MTMIKPCFVAFALLLCIAISANAQNEGIQFDYGGENGPEKWGSLNPHYTKCSAGKLQSPINIQKRQTFYNRRLGSLTRDYHLANATVLNNICNVAVLYEKGAGEMVIQGKKYTLKQMHWHTPAEHHIDGDQLAAELHMIHHAQDGAIAVVATLYKLGDEDHFLTKIKDKLGKLKADKIGNATAQVELGEVDTRHLQPKTQKYFRYVGSLTTPPCTENVIWTILGKVRSMSKEQVELLKAPLKILYKNNSRPVQPLNGRKVQMFHKLKKDEDEANDDKTKSD